MKTTQIYYFIVSVGQKYRLAQLVSLLWVSHSQSQMSASWALLGRVWEKSTSKVIQIVGRLQFLVVVGLGSLFPCWLSARSHFHPLQAIFIPWLMALFAVQNGSLSPSPQISPTSPSASSFVGLRLLPHLSASLCCLQFYY